ncbi:MAG: ParB N-terminal domain-containing protein [Planctomycetes bacterium]|nr:ParB N-terminal domain-containing protein [Planctomycetota bacterium]
MSTIKMMPTGHLKADPGNYRKEADEPELGHLGDDLVCRGILVPLLARPDGTLIDGWRRWLAAQRKGIKELPVIITDRPEAEIPGIRMATVFHKADLKASEKWQALEEFKRVHPESGMQEIAKLLHIDPSMVTRLLSPSKCTLEWQEALKEGRVGISDCYAASKLPEKEQAALLTMKLSGASRDAIEQAGRKSRKANVPAVRMSRVRCMLPSGVCIVTSGEKLSLDDLIESFAEAHKEAKKAREQGLDAKTFQAVMKDKSRKG